MWWWCCQGEVRDVKVSDSDSDDGSSDDDDVDSADGAAHKPKADKVCYICCFAFCWHHFDKARLCSLTLYGHIETAEQRTIIWQYGDW